MPLACGVALNIFLAHPRGLNRRELANTTLADLRKGACWVWSIAKAAAERCRLSPQRAGGAGGADHPVGTGRLQRPPQGPRSLHEVWRAGVTLRAPSWGGELIGTSPFPVERMAAMLAPGSGSLRR